MHRLQFKTAAGSGGRIDLPAGRIKDALRAINALRKGNRNAECAFFRLHDRKIEVPTLSQTDS